jgi:hypothetical protein
MMRSAEFANGGLAGSPPGVIQVREFQEKLQYVMGNVQETQLIQQISSRFQGT